MSLTRITSELITDGTISTDDLSSTTVTSISGSSASSSFSSRITLVEDGTTTKTLVSSSAQIASDISGSFTAGTGLDLSSGELSVDVSDFMANGSNNRIITATGTDAQNAEANLTFDGSTLNVTGDATITGTLTAQEVHTEFESASILFTSGSTKFGDTSDDVHSMTGSLNVSGSITMADGDLSVTDDVVFGATATVETGLNLESGTFTVKNATSDSNGLKISQGGSDASNILNHYNGTLNLGVSNSVRFIIDSNSRISLGNNDSGTNNTIFGNQAGDDIASGGNYNTIFGHNAGSKLTTGDASVFIGQGAGQVHVTGNRNIAIGHNAMVDTDAGSTSYASNDNLFIGVDAGGGTWTNTAIQQNVAIGNYSMDSALNEAQENTAVGYGSLGSITTADKVVAIGFEAGKLITTGGSNTIVGAAAGDAMEGASDAVLIGTSAGGAITSGDYNVVIGKGAGAAISTSDGNTMVGTFAGQAITGGIRNTLIGYGTMATADGDEDQNVVIGHGAGGSINNDDADHNVIIGADAGTGGTGAMARCVAIGYQAMKSTAGSGTTGNVAIGYEALKDLSSGTGNLAVGYLAGANITTTANNTAVGYNALETCSSGNRNTVFGYQAGVAITSGNDNICIGNAAGDGLQDANGCVIIGQGSDAATDANYANVIGHNITGTATQRSRIGAGSNYVELDHSTSGNNWANTSDERIKKDIVDNDLGLDFVNNLRPIKYKEKPLKDWPKQFLAKDAEEDLNAESDKEFVGFISQEVKEIMDKNNTTFSGWQVDEESGREALQYDKFVVPLVKAVQELSTENDDLKKRMEVLENK